MGFIVLIMKCKRTLPKHDRVKECRFFSFVINSLCIFQKVCYIFIQFKHLLC
jgi:hypothetical protein